MVLTPGEQAGGNVSVQLSTDKIGVSIQSTGLGVGWNQVELGVTNRTGEPIILGLRYGSGPAHTLYAHLEGGANLSWILGERNEIGLVMGSAFTLKIILFFPLPGTYSFTLLYRPSYSEEFVSAGTIVFRVGGEPSKYEEISPWDKRLYENMKDGKPRMIVTLTGLNKTDTGDYLLYFTLYDRMTGEAYSPVYLASQLIRAVEGTDNVVLSPLALQAILQLKQYSSDRYVTLRYDTSFKFNAYTEFFKNLFSGHPEDARAWFMERIEEMVAKALQRNGVPVRGVSVYSLKLDYDTLGIITGTNPNVDVEAGIAVTIDPAVPWWLIGVIIASAVIAIIGYEVYLTINSIETTKQEYYKTLQGYASAWEKYEEAYREWLENPRGSPPTPPNLPEPKTPQQLVTITPSEFKGLLSGIPWTGIATIIALVLGGYIAYKLFKK